MWQPRAGADRVCHVTMLTRTPRSGIARCAHGLDCNAAITFDKKWAQHESYQVAPRITRSGEDVTARNLPTVDPALE